MNLENYKIFYWTDKQLKKSFSENTLNKYYKIIAYLYQNGYYFNCEDEEVEEQLKMFNFFEHDWDFEELQKCSGYQTNNRTYETGGKIVSEELYDVVKNTTFCRKETSESPVLIKGFAETYWENIKSALDRLFYLFNSSDLEIYGYLKNIENLQDIQNKINELKDSIEKEKKVLTWIKFTNLINIIYSLYIKIGKQKTDTHKLTIASNFNDEIYGATGCYNPNNGEIKCIIGSAVSDVKICMKGNLSKIKNKVGEILKGEKDGPDKYIDWLELWYKGHETNNEYAQQIVVGCLLNGILSLLSLKHNLNFLNDKRNYNKADDIVKEFSAICKYCGVTKDYLLE